MKVKSNYSWRTRDPPIVGIYGGFIVKGTSMHKCSKGRGILFGWNDTIPIANCRSRIFPLLGEIWHRDFFSSRYREFFFFWFHKVIFLQPLALVVHYHNLQVVFVVLSFDCVGFVLCIIFRSLSAIWYRFESKHNVLGRWFCIYYLFISIFRYYLFCKFSNKFMYLMQ